MNIADSGCSGQFPLFLFRFCLCGWLMDQEQHKQEYHTFDTTPIWQQTLFVALHRLPQMSSALALLNHNFLFRRHMDGASVWGAFFSGVVLKLQPNCKHPKMIYNNLCYPRVKTKICQAQYNSFFRYLCVCVFLFYLFINLLIKKNVNFTTLGPPYLLGPYDLHTLGLGSTQSNHVFILKYCNVARKVDEFTEKRYDTKWLTGGWGSAWHHCWTKQQGVVSVKSSPSQINGTYPNTQEKRPLVLSSVKTKCYSRALL